MAKVTKTTWNLLLRIVILAGAYGYIAWKLWNLPAGALTSFHFSAIYDHAHYGLPFIFVFLLMFLNWGLETLKWQQLILKIEKVPFFKAYMAIFTGVTASVFTPNRIGEYIGRVFILQNREPAKGILITLVGSLAQILIYLTGGALAGLLLFYRYILPWRPQLAFLSWILIPAVILLIAGSIAIFSYLPNFTRLMRKLLPRKWHRIRSWIGVLGFYSRREMLEILFLSLLRYLVFTFQYVILLKMYGLDLSLGALLTGIPVIIMLLVVVPSVALSELGVRNSVALFVFGLMLPAGMKNDPLIDISIIAAATSLWLINVAIPAIIGSFFVFKLRFFPSNGNKA
ncbi:MAG: hypothetical protein PWR20_2441 [Bacteroidales bacterium]|jgi:hypothetical protein|nr:hypothetical protein [Bacteroidales bacterium]MDN5328478.1 hypothetical protein [Bacteroidales bacterium]